MDTTDTLEITIQRKTDDGWPVVVEYRPANELTIRREGLWQIGTDNLDLIEKKLLPHHRDPMAYGEVLGRALFQDEVRDLFREARSRTESYLRVLLVVEDPTLKHLHWEWLSGPIRMGGKWGLLSLDQRLPFSLYLPSVTERHFPPLAKSDLQALVVVANPPQENPYKLAAFEQSKTIAGVRQVLGDIPSELLADGDGGAELPTIDHLATQLSGKQYTLLYIIAHGMFQTSSGETTLYLLDEQKQIRPVPAATLLERLDMVQGRYGLPHFVFLATCESADPKAEALGALGGLAQRMVRDLGIPAVVAMTQKVSIETANALAISFFTQLCEHGEVDRALVEACAGLANRGDIAVPTLYSRLEGRPLFAVGGVREPTAGEVKAALDKLDALVETRCPVLDEQYRTLAQTIRHLIDTANELLSNAARKEKEAALAAVNRLCEETLDLSFQGLALGQEPPAYHAHECPFPGLYAFRVEDARFFFGREQVIQRLQSHLLRSNFLAVLGPSGSGKSSVVLAGLIPQMQKSLNIDLSFHYMTPTETPLVKLQEITAGLAADHTVMHLLVVDQFEELFTLCRDEAQRKAFLGHLLSVTQVRYVIITMRADFLGDCARYPDLGEAVQNNLQLIAPMTTAELRSAMEHQANQVYLRFEADLSHTILSEVEGEPGAMPLLQHLLRQLWERRHGRWLLTKEYRNLGGIRKAIAHTADELYERASVVDQKLLRHIFVRLTQIGEETDQDGNYRDTRRRVQIKHLTPTGAGEDSIRNLVDQLTNSRLVVTDGRANIEVAHEALIRYWSRLRVWLDEGRSIYRLRDSISTATGEWIKNSKGEDWLDHRGQRLVEITSFGYDKLGLNIDEVEYVEQCKRFERETGEAQRKSDLSEMGWGVIFPYDKDGESVPCIKKALAELLTLRGEQAGNYFKVFEGVDAYRPGESARDFLNRHGVGTNFNPEKVPYYLLIVGNPEAIPFEFQYQLQTRYAVGRLDLDTLTEYASYARSVMTVESGQYLLPQTVALFGTQHPNDRATQMLTQLFTNPLLIELRNQMPEWQSNAALDSEATKPKLASLISDNETPTLLLLAAHGIGFPPESAQQLSYQGALLCQEWPGPKEWRGRGAIPEDFYFAGVDISDEATLLGSMTFSFSEYFCGTPRYSDFPKSGQRQSNQLAPASFVSALPKRLLGHPKGGMLAVIGHIDMVWFASVQEGQGIKNIEHFTKAFRDLMKGYPVGLAIDYLCQRYVQIASEFASAIASEDESFGNNPAIFRLKTEMIDARNYIILGDPATRLKIGDSANPDSRPTIKPVELYNELLVKQEQTS